MNKCGAALQFAIGMKALGFTLGRMGAVGNDDPQSGTVHPMFFQGVDQQRQILRVTAESGFVGNHQYRPPEVYAMIAKKFFQPAAKQKRIDQLVRFSEGQLYSVLRRKERQALAAVGDMDVLSHGYAPVLSQAELAC